MKIIKDLHAILVGLYHMVVGDIQEWQKRRAKSTDLEPGALEIHEPPPKIEPVTPKREPYVAPGVRVQRTLERRNRYADHTLRELVEISDERRKERDLQFVMKLINQNQ